MEGGGGKQKGDSGRSVWGGWCRDGVTNESKWGGEDR